MRDAILQEIMSVRFKLRLVVFSSTWQLSLHNWTTSGLDNPPGHQAWASSKWIIRPLELSKTKTSDTDLSFLLTLHCSLLFGQNTCNVICMALGKLDKTKLVSNEFYKHENVMFLWSSMVKHHFIQILFHKVKEISASCSRVSIQNVSSFLINHMPRYKT